MEVPGFSTTTLSARERAALLAWVEPGREKWEEIPWRVSLTEARREAAQRKKPLLFWAMAGHPLGCTWNNGVTGRALVFSHPKVIAAIQADFVAVAVDKWYLARQKDDDGAFFKRACGARGARQGLYVTDAAGTPLAADHFHPDPERFLSLLQSGKAKFTPTQTEVNGLTSDTRFDRMPPRGGWVVRVFTRIGGQESGPWTPNRAIGRDRLWISAAEKAALLTGAVPDTLKTRLIRFHLTDNVRGEPDFWRPEELRETMLTLQRGQLTGTVRLANHNDTRGYEARLQGVVMANRFEVLCWGDAWGRSTYTPGEPPGRFPLVLGFTLAPAQDPLREMPPQALKTGEYRLT
jgi:hypothetical protein